MKILIHESSDVRPLVTREIDFNNLPLLDPPRLGFQTRELRSVTYEYTTGESVCYYRVEDSYILWDFLMMFVDLERRGKVQYPKVDKVKLNGY